MRLFALHCADTILNSSDRGKRINLRVRKTKLIGYSSTFIFPFLALLLLFSLRVMDSTVNCEQKYAESAFYRQYHED